MFLEKANSPDKNVRENALRVFAETYKVLKEDIWRLLGKDINGKVKGLLEQRFKQVATTSGVGNSSRGGNPLQRSTGPGRGPNSSNQGSSRPNFNANQSKGTAPDVAVDEITD